MPPSRRQFIHAAASVAIGFAGLRRLVHGDDMPAEAWNGYGPLRPDGSGVLELPEGFTCRVISRWGDEMSDGLLVPALTDGMAAFPGQGADEGLTVLVRNHEIGSRAPGRYGAFGPRFERLSLVNSSRLYDRGRHGEPLAGGTTTIVYDTRTGEVKRQFLSLGGTGRNCAGGPTPWGTWLTCEEWTQRADEVCARDHGYVFEVPARGDMALTHAEPLRAMGRFMHEAVAVDPVSGIVFQTEDREDGCIYRFIPREPGALARGGRLQALAIAGQSSLDTRNRGERTVRPGDRLPARWIDLDDIEAPEDDLRHRAWARGAARFARNEGMWYGNGAVYFASTTGGPLGLGQIWRYVPSPAEGTSAESDAPGVLELFIEPNNGDIVRNADNLTVAPNGDLFVCEDGTGRDRVIIVDPAGRVAPFARNMLGDDEFAGACFSPDGSTFFVNIQGSGLTLAISGPFGGVSGV